MTLRSPGAPIDSNNNYLSIIFINTEWIMNLKLIAT